MFSIPLLRFVCLIFLASDICFAQTPSVGHGPGDKPPTSMANKTVSKKPVAGRKVSRRAQSTYDNLVAQAQRRIDANDLTSAKKLLEQAQSIAKNDFERHQAEDMLAQAERRHQISALTKTAQQASRRADHATEIESYEKALAVDPTDESVSKQLVKSLLAEGDRCARSGNIEQAITDYDKAAKILKDTDEAAVIQEKIRHLIFRDADAAYKARKYSATRASYKQSFERWPDNTDIVNEIVERCLSNGRDLYQNAQYNEAQLFADDALAYAPGSGDALQLQKRTEAQMDRQRGEGLLAEERTEEALKVLRSAQQWLSDDADLAREIAVADARLEFAPAMVKLKGGRFRMGSSGGGPEEQPTHTVQVSPFLIGKYEVTNAQYRQFCDDTHHGYPQDPQGWGRYFRDFPDYPVVNVSYNDALRYCEWLSKRTAELYRLPTEAEWEYAARGNEVSAKYEWGDYFHHRKANGRDFQDHRATSIRAKTTPVGDFTANSFGLHDMTGNVAEWCADYFSSQYYRRGEIHDPQGPASGSLRSVRGGSWNDNEDDLRVAHRVGVTPSSRSSQIGFRIVRELPNDRSRF